MIALVASLWARFSGRAVAIAAGAAAALGTVLTIRQSGKDAERARVAIEAERSRQAGDRAREAVDRLGDAEVRRQLDEKWSRP